MHRQAGDARRGRIFQTVAQEGGDRGKRRKKDWESRRLSGGLRFGFFAGPGEEHGRRRRRCPLRERVREKEKISSGARARVQKGTYCFHNFCLADSGRFGSWIGIKIGIMRHCCVLNPSS